MSAGCLLPNLRRRSAPTHAPRRPSSSVPSPVPIPHFSPLLKPSPRARNRRHGLHSLALGATSDGDLRLLKGKRRARSLVNHTDSGRFLHSPPHPSPPPSSSPPNPKSLHPDGLHPRAVQDREHPFPSVPFFFALLLRSGVDFAALCAKGRSFEAEELLDAMGAKGVLLPNRTSFNTVIKGLCKEEEVGAAMVLFKKVPEVPRQHGITWVPPNFETYITLLEALINKGVFGPALEVCQECLQKKWYMEREEWYVIRQQV